MLLSFPFIVKIKYITINNKWNFSLAFFICLIASSIATNQAPKLKISTNTWTPRGKKASPILLGKQVTKQDK